MNDIKIYLNNLTAKDENKAAVAAKYLLDNSDLALFKLLADKTDFLFDFIKDNVRRRLERAVNKDNFKNILSFFSYYSPEFDDLFASILAKYADENLTDELFELLENGDNSQKTYAAKYFNYIPDTISIDLLMDNMFSDLESLSFNCAQALGKMNDKDSYKKALEMLASDDDFDRLKAVKFFVAYGKNPPLKEIFEAMLASSMPENIAGQIPYLASLVENLNNDNQKNILITVDNILSGLGEILPLSQIFQFELYDVLSDLIGKNKQDNHYHSKIAQILLKALAKMKMICTNDEYIFDEDKNTKQELKEILNLLEKQNEQFWVDQKESVLKELKHCNHRILAGLDIVKEYKLKSALEDVKYLLNGDNEIVICEAVSTLKELDSLSEVNKNDILSRLNDENIKAIINNYWG